MVEINKISESLKESLNNWFHIFLNYSEILDVCITSDGKFIFEIFKNKWTHMEVHEVKELSEENFNFDTWVWIYDHKSLRAWARLKDADIIKNYKNNTFIIKNESIINRIYSDTIDEIEKWAKKTNNILSE